MRVYGILDIVHSMHHHFQFSSFNFPSIFVSFLLPLSIYYYIYPLYHALSFIHKTGSLCGTAHIYIYNS